MRRARGIGATPISQPLRAASSTTSSASSAPPEAHLAHPIPSQETRMTGQTDVLWFIPTHGDGRYLASTEGARETDLPYLKQIAQAADDLGYFGVLLPTGRSCEDSWVVASALAPWAKRLRFLVAVRPGLQEPAAAARMAATLDRISNGRLLINVVTGGDPIELKGDGIFLNHDDRYAVTAEFLEIWKRLLAGEEGNFKGKHLAGEGGKVFYPPVQQPYPP